MTRILKFLNLNQTYRVKPKSKQELGQEGHVDTPEPPSDPVRFKPNYGGELPYPDDWIDLCEDAAKDRLQWVVAPAVTGSLSLLCLTGTFLISNRRAKVKSGPAGTKAA